MLLKQPEAGFRQLAARACGTPLPEFDEMLCACLGFVKQALPCRAAFALNSALATLHNNVYALLHAGPRFCCYQSSIASLDAC
jgi:hypothetical protein